MESVEHGDLALLSNVWVFSGDGFEIGARTAEVARRQVDGSWRYVIDHPFGGGMTPAGD